MANKSVDLVISYIVNSGQVDARSYKPLQDALEEGYRVLDILPTAAMAGGSASFGTVVVTVLLTMTGQGSAYGDRLPGARLAKLPS